MWSPKFHNELDTDYVTQNNRCQMLSGSVGGMKSYVIQQFPYFPGSDDTLYACRSESNQQR